MQPIGLKSKKILEISVTTSSKKEILEEMQKYLENVRSDKRKVIRIVTPNPEQIVLAQTDPHFAKLLNQADVALPDGIGLAWAAGVPRIPGVELMEDLVALAAARGYTIALIGGRGGVAVAALECLKRRYPGLVGWAMEPEDGDVFEKLQGTAPRLIFVGLGAPKQELFIERLVRLTSYVLRPFVLMSVGGAFDMIAGRTQRAPRLMRLLGLEWLWRLAREPWRLRRQLALLKFLWLVVLSRINRIR